MNWTCPQCGESNPDEKKLCGLCGEMRPVVKPEPVVVRAMEPAPPPPPQVMPGVNRWGSNDPNHPSEAEKRRLAEEAARRIMGTPPPVSSAPSGVGCGNLAVFIMFFPWSLIVLPMPGGLRNKKAGQVLLVVAAVVILLGIISVVVAIPTVGPILQKAMQSTRGAYNVPDN